MDGERSGVITSFSIYRQGENTDQMQHRRRWVRELLALCLILALAAGLLRFSLIRYLRAAYPLEYSELVSTYAGQYDFDPSLIYALIRTESGFDPEAVSSAEAFGLMQITQDTFEWAQSRTGIDQPLPANELFKPETNIQYGVLVLSLLRQEFTDTRTMLAAYNAGIGNVRRWLQNPDYSDDGVTLKYIPFEETRGYVQKIPDAKTMYEQLYGLSTGS